MVKEGGVHPVGFRTTTSVSLSNSSPQHKIKHKNGPEETESLSPRPGLDLQINAVSCIIALLKSTLAVWYWQRCLSGLYQSGEQIN